MTGVWEVFRRDRRGAPFEHAGSVAAPDAEVAEAGARAVAVAFALLEGAGITGEGAVHATRCLRAAVHGFVLLEISGGFGLAESTDASFDRLVGMLTAGIFDS